MGEPYRQSYRARWADMDFNQHMRNAAFLGCAEETRMRYLDSNGWTMAEFMKRRLGPVVVEDRLVYKRELHLLESFHVGLELAGISDDARKMKLRNVFTRDSDQAVSAIVESVVLWVNLDARKPVVPPDELAALWRALPRTEDFAALGG